MSEYKSIKGKTVQFLGTDPSETSTEGQVWYNSTAGAFKSVVALEAWSSGAPINFNRAYIAGFGTTTAAVGAGGYNSPATYETATEEYNGSGWSTGGALNTARYGLRGAGSQTAGLVFMGVVPGSPDKTGATEEYDGSAWTNGGSLSQARYHGAAAGTQTAGLAFGGGIAPGPTNFTTNTEEYNGTAWTAGGALNTVTRDNGSASAAPQTAALSFGGNNGSINAQSEEYDGSTWTVVNSMNTARVVMGGSGVQTDALAYGGTTPPDSAATESYNGTSWSTSPATLATARRYLAGAGSNGSAAVAFQGKSGATNTTLTEEYNKSINVITAAAWASANSQSVPSYGRSGWGTADAGWLAGGGFPSAKTDTEEYDGTNWTSGGSLNTARDSASVGGPQTASIFASGSRNSAVELYDGSTWTSTTSIPTVRSAAGGAGTQTSLVVFGGSITGSPTFAISTAVEEWNGSAWTAGTSLPSVRGSMNGSAFGTSSDDAFSAGGATASPPGAIPHSVTSETLSYNGTTWTEEADILTARVAPYAFGTSGSAIIAGGDTNNSGATSVLSEQWNGTSWSTNPSIATGRYTGGRAGTSSSGWIGGGYPGGAPSSSATEEFTGETSAINIKTLTTS